MKKLLVLMLVLGITSMAHGALSLSLTGAAPLEAGTINVVVTGAEADMYLALVIQAPGALAGFDVGAAAPSMSGSIMPITVNGDDGEVWSFGSVPDEVYSDGVWMSANWTGATEEVHVTLYSTPDASTWIEEACVTVGVPEPMTIALLGLGGLFLRRRR